MEEKLVDLYKKCVEELNSIKININCYHIIKSRRHKIKKYDIFKNHHIEISKWVMELDEAIIKNTIMHEIIHCLPYCNNHGKEFKKYATYINEKLGYNITRLGNKEEDYKKSNLEYKEKINNYKYKIICNKCGQIIYRQRFRKELINNYRCGKCGGTLRLI